jgi:hypothetical protein
MITLTAKKHYDGLTLTHFWTIKTNLNEFVCYTASDCLENFRQGYAIGKGLKPSDIHIEIVK